MPYYDLTIAIPVYNEEGNLLKLKKELDSFISKSPLKTKVLFINDGSNDGSLALIKNFCKEPNYNYIALETNKGISTAIKAGIDHCNTKYFGYIDSDLQTSPQDFLKFFQYLEDYSMINGIRRRRKDSIMKVIASKVANVFRRTVIKDGIEDTCCPLKVIHTDVAKKIPFFNGMHRFIPALVQLDGGTVKQIEVSHFPRYAGKSKYHVFNRLTGPFLDTMVFLWMRKKHIDYKISESALHNE